MPIDGADGVNVVIGTPDTPYGVAELAEAGVKRISVGVTFARLALGAVMRAAAEMRDAGTFSFGNEGASYRDLDKIFRGFGG